MLRKTKKKNKSANDRTATHGFEAMCEIIAVGKLVKGTVFFLMLSGMMNDFAEFGGVINN